MANDSFYRELLCADNNWKLLWTLKDKKSHWFQDISKLTEFALKSTGDIYFGLGETDQKLPHTKRALSSQIVSIRALHLDIDLVSEIAHKKQQLPDSIEAGLEIAHSILEPTYIINSGYGLHAYWLLYEHYKNFDQDQMTSFIQQFQEAHRKKYPQYKLDATHDLTRILRCPGSKNYKDPDNPKDCMILEHNESAYYDLTEIEDAISVDYDKIVVEKPVAETQLSENKLIDASGKPKALKLWNTKDFEAYATRHKLYIDEDAKIDGDKFAEIAIIEEPKFLHAYNHSEPFGDASASDYDWALMNIVSNYKFTDQELITLMVQHRRQNGEKIKKKGIAYFVRTLLKIRDKEKIDKIERTSKIKKNNIAQEKLTSTDKETIREYLYNKLDLSINRIIRYPKSPNPEFHLEVTDKPDAMIVLGSFKDGIMTQLNFITKIAGEGLPLPNQVTNKVWADDIIPKLRMLTETGVSPQASTYEGQIKVWLHEYFESSELLDSYEEFQDMDDKGKSFHHEDKVFFNYDRLADWVQRNKGQRLSFSFTVMMQNVGFKMHTFNNYNHSKIDIWSTTKDFHKKKVIPKGSN